MLKFGGYFFKNNMNNLKIMIIGPGRSGKDWMAEKLGLDYISSSKFAFDNFLWDSHFKHKYDDKDAWRLGTIRAHYRKCKT